MNLACPHEVHRARLVEELFGVVLHLVLVEHAAVVVVMVVVVVVFGQRKDMLFNVNRCRPRVTVWNGRSHHIIHFMPAMIEV